MSRLRLIAAAALALVLALPATALAASVDVVGTVTAPEGVAVAGVEIAVLVQGTDQVVATATDETGAFALQVDAEVGAVLEVNATGVQTRSEPDENGCVTLITPSGRLEITLAELPLAPFEIALDGATASLDCPETPTPEPTAKPTPKPTPKPTKKPAQVEAVATPGRTPPATDALAAGGPSAPPSLAVVLAMLVAASAMSIAVARRQHLRAVARSRALARARRFQAHPLRRD